MKKPTKCRTGVLSQRAASIFADGDQSGVSNFALRERKFKKNCPLLQQISIENKFCPLHYIVIVIANEQFTAYALKIYHNCRKDEELVRLLRSYAKKISILKCYEKN